MLYDEKLLSLDQAAKSLPGSPSRSTLWRWCRIGINGIKLEYRRVGRRICTSQEALERFTRKLAETDRAVDSKQMVAQKCSERDKAILRAKRELELAGI